MKAILIGINHTNPKHKSTVIIIKQTLIPIPSAGPRIRVTISLKTKIRYLLTTQETIIMVTRERILITITIRITKIILIISVRRNTTRGHFHSKTLIKGEESLLQITSHAIQGEILFDTEADKIFVRKNFVEKIGVKEEETAFLNLVLANNQKLMVKN